VYLGLVPKVFRELIGGFHDYPFTEKGEAGASVDSVGSI
jgi:hypothetical protein